MNENKNIKVGILTLQGDFERHQHQIYLLGAIPVEVRLAEDLAELSALIIPGGESTTMSILLDRFNLRRPLMAFAQSHPVYGTCAGMILLSKNIENNISTVKSLGLIDIDINRNGYGRQVHSFETELEFKYEDTARKINVSFIRAPRVTRVGKGVMVLAEYRGYPVLVREKNILASSFHAELDDDTSVLKYFLDNFL